MCEQYGVADVWSDHIGYKHFNCCHGTRIQVLKRGLVSVVRTFVF